MNPKTHAAMLQLVKTHDIKDLQIQFQLYLSVIVSGQLIEGYLVTDDEYNAIIGQTLNINAELSKAFPTQQATVRSCHQALDALVDDLKRELTENSEACLYLRLGEETINKHSQKLIRLRLDRIDAFAIKSLRLMSPSRD